MDLGSAARVLLRRWLVVLTGMILTVGALAYVVVSTPPAYTAGARILLLLPNDARGPEVVGSPFLYLPSGLEVIAQLVAGTPATRAFQELKAAEGLMAAAEVSVDPRSPMLVVEVSGADTDDVLATRDWVVARLQDELLQIQVEEGAPNAQIARGRVFGAEDVPRSGGRTWLRPALSVAGVGGVITLLAAFGIDRLMLRRRTARLARDGSAELATDDLGDPAESDATESPDTEHQTP